MTENKNEATRTILNKGCCHVVDGNKAFWQNLPAWMHLGSETLDDFNTLVSALGQDRALALMQKGLVQAVIDVRAQARYKNKAGDYTGNPLGYEPSLLPAPAQDKAAKAAKSLSNEDLLQIAKERGLV